MPRYYLHLHNHLNVSDPEGIELPDLDAARAHAFHETRILLGELAKEEGRIVLHHHIDVEDGNGAVLATVRFGDVVTIET